MKRVLLAAVMTGFAGGAAYGADFGDLGGVRADGMKALAAEEGLAVPDVDSREPGSEAADTAGTGTSRTREAAAGMRLQILPGSGLTAFGSIRYSATNPACTVTTWDEGSMGSAQKETYKEFHERDGLITIPMALPSYCGYQLGSPRDPGTLAFHIPGRAKPYNSVRIIRSDAPQGLQTVECSIRSIAGKDLVDCRGDIRLDAENKAVVKAVLK